MGAVMLLGAVFSIAIVMSWLTRLHQAEATACDGSAALVPQTRPGPPWRQHRHWLVPGDGGVPPGQSYLLWNRRTDERFRWGRAESVSGKTRFLVPTRYAELANRRWQEDPWTYCLVLAPQPPFRMRVLGFETSSQAREASIVAGASTAITASVTAAHNATVLIDIEVYDERGVRVAQWVFDEEPLRADRPATYEVLWHSSVDMEPGIYVITVGIFAPGWGELRHWNDGTGVLMLKGSSSVADQSGGALEWTR